MLHPEELQSVAGEEKGKGEVRLGEKKRAEEHRRTAYNRGSGNISPRVRGAGSWDDRVDVPTTLLCSAQATEGPRDPGTQGLRDPGTWGKEGERIRCRGVWSRESRNTVAPRAPFAAALFTPF